MDGSRIWPRDMRDAAMESGREYAGARQADSGFLARFHVQMAIYSADTFKKQGLPTVSSREHTVEGMTPVLNGLIWLTNAS